MKGVRVLGVPSAWGAPRPEVAATPGRLRAAGLLDWLGDGELDVEDGGDVAVPRGANGIGWSDDRPPDHLSRVVQTCRSVRSAVAATLDDGRLPVLVGGGCDLAIGAVAGLADRRGAPLVAWFDAHGDLKTPDTSPSGLLAGMPCAVVMGHGPAELVAVGGDVPRPQSVHLLGGRDLDEGERRHLRQWHVRHLDTEHVRTDGAEETVVEILGIPAVALLPPEARTAPARPPPGQTLYLHLDIDALDPEDAPGVAFPVSGGFRVDEIADTAGYLCLTGRVGALSLASADLERDDGRTLRALRTILLSIGDALSAGEARPTAD